MSQNSAQAIVRAVNVCTLVSIGVKVSVSCSCAFFLLFLVQQNFSALPNPQNFSALPMPNPDATPKFQCSDACYAGHVEGRLYYFQSVTHVASPLADLGGSCPLPLALRASRLDQ